MRFIVFEFNATIFFSFFLFLFFFAGKQLPLASVELVLSHLTCRKDGARLIEGHARVGVSEGRIERMRHLLAVEVDNKWRILLFNSDCPRTTRPAFQHKTEQRRYRLPSGCLELEIALFLSLNFAVGFRGVCLNFADCEGQ